jgi:predicted AlkP superfamily phosphohydrolase/phosphomutase/tetratricopeptide (TPR) repeat protein
MGKRLAKKVLVVGWDAADWKIINPLLDAGKLPSLKKLIDNGAMGNMATLDPPLSPVLWTSIATGKTADKHGVLNFVEPDPDNADLRPVSVTSRKVKAIWNILTQKGYKTHLVGWWPSHPAEPINGVCVSNHFQKQPKNHTAEWLYTPGAVHPKEYEEELKQYRIQYSEITGAMLLPFVPDAAKVDQEKDRSLGSIANNIAQAASLQAAATWIMENEDDWDFMGVYFDMIDHFCHNFMKYHPPRMNGIPEEYYELYKGVIDGAYIFQDMMLDRLLQLAGDDVTVILLSDHGFHSDHLRPKKLPQEPIAPALEHAPYGVVVVSGPNILKDELIFGATLLDVTPTILTMFGLPIGKDMDGKPLLQVFSEPVTPEYIDSWENVEGECGMHSPDMIQDKWAAQEAMDQLVELGYVDAPGEDAALRIKRVKDETDFILAKVYISNKKYDAGIPIVEKLWKENPEAARYGLKLAHTLQVMRDFKGLRRVMDELRSRELKNMPHLDYLEGTLLLAENKPRKALQFLEKAEKNISHMPTLHIQVGNVYLKIRKWDAAEKSFRKAIEIENNNASAYLGLAITLLRQYKYEESAEMALTSIGLNHLNSDAHYYLGEALYNLEEFASAAEAFEVVVSLTPGSKKGHEWLIKLYENHLGQADKAEKSRKFIADKIKGTITIVSGLPRSGTSMMMQMLKAGGMDILTDNLRENDINNPKGYLEYEKVKGMANDVSWMHEAVGKTVKIISHQLKFLPANYNYKIIFMQRDIVEVLKSQQKMLGKSPDTFPTKLAETFQIQQVRAISSILGEPNMELLTVNYSEIIANPEEECENINAFLGEDLDVQKMAGAIDKSLYRNKTTTV